MSGHKDADEFFDEDHAIAIHDDDFDQADAKGLPTTHLRGMGLDLSLAAAKKDEKDASRGVQEEEVMVVFDLPDGSQGESTFKLGQTVEVLKSFVESEYGIPMVEQNLFLEDRPMMNPLSLLDFPEAKGVDEIYVRVDGPLPADAKK